MHPSWLYCGMSHLPPPPKPQEHCYPLATHSIRKAEVSEVVKYLPFAEWQSFEVLPRRDRPELFEVS